MKLNSRLVVVIAILLFITIQQTYKRHQEPARRTTYPSLKKKDTSIGTELLNPGNIILVKLP